MMSRPTTKFGVDWPIIAATRTARSEGFSLRVAAKTPAGTPTDNAISIDSSASSSVSGKRWRITPSTGLP